MSGAPGYHSMSPEHDPMSAPDEFDRAAAALALVIIAIVAGLMGAGIASLVWWLV